MLDEFGVEVPGAPDEVDPEPTPEALRLEATKFFGACWSNWSTLAKEVSEALDKAVADATHAAKQQRSERVHEADDQEMAEMLFSDRLTKLWVTIKFPTAEYYRRAEKDFERYGFLPMLARRYIGRLLAESFCERILSVANRVVTKGNTQLGCDDVALIVMLRTNTALIKEMFTADSALAKSITIELSSSAPSSAKKRTRDNSCE